MSFTLFLQSGAGEVDQIGQTNAITYNIDWNATPQNVKNIEYELTFTFVSYQIATTTDTIIFPTIFWGATPDVYRPTLTNGAQTSTILGFVRPNTYGAVGQFSADINQNVPIRISSKPTQNQFKVLLNDGNGALYPMGATPYCLSIYFRTIDTFGCLD